MTYRNVNMTPAIDLALKGVMSIRHDQAFEVGSVEQVRPGLSKVRLTWPRETWFVCLSLDLAILHSEAQIRDRLQDPSDFDGEWLIHFVPGDFNEHMAEAPGEGAKHLKVKSLGIDMEAAARDYRAGFKDVKAWIEGVWEAHSFSFRTVGEVVCWRVG